MNAQQLKNSILQEAIEGRLVPQDPNDEPASVLLDKIRKEKAKLVKEKKIKADKNESYIYRSEDGHWMEHFEDKKREEVCIDDDIPFEIPNRWGWTRLNSLAEIVRGGSPRPAGSPEFYGGDIPFLKVADLTKDDSMYVKTHSATIKEAGLKKTREVVADTLLLTNSGATLGVPKICTFKTTFNDGIAAFLCLSDNLKPYLFWFLCAKTEAFRSINQGTAQPNLNTDIIKETLLPMPPLEEQKRIVQTIEKLMPLIKEYGKAQASLEKLNEELPERLKKSILQEAIEGRLVPQDPNDEPASVLLEKIRKEKVKLVKEGKLKKKDLEELSISEEEKCFTIPKGWECAKLSFITSLLDGEKRDGDYVCLDAKYLRGKSTGEKLSKGKFVQKDDTIILVDGENSGEVFTVPCDGYMGSTFKQLWVSESIHLPYVLYFIRFHKDILRNSKKGAAIPHLNKDIFNNLVVGIPPLAEQKRIVDKIEQLLHKIDKLTL